MSRSSITSWLTVFLTLVALASGVEAQRFQPFIEPDEFDPDLQFFAPAEIDEFGSGPPQKTGWFFTYDRMYINVSRPESPVGGNMFSRPFGGDFAWGNRYDIGYMTPEDHGWLFSLWDIDGPLVADRERGFGLIRDPGIEDVEDDDDDVELPPGPFVLRVPAFEFPGLGRRLETNLSSIELNKTFRLKPLHNGSVLEPFFGVRYINFGDRHLDGSPLFDVPRIDDNGDDDNGVGAGTGLPIPDPSLPQLMDPELQFAQTLFLQRVKNQALGGQVGVRWHRRRGRWLLSSDFRFMAGNNWQFYERDLRIIPFDPEDVDDDNGDDDDNGRQPVRAPIIGGTPIFEDDQPGTHRIEHLSENLNRLMLMGELRVEAAYEITRDVSLRVGVGVMHFGRGIGRADTAPWELFAADVDPETGRFMGPTAQRFLGSNQQVTTAGTTFGFVINR